MERKRGCCGVKRVFSPVKSRIDQQRKPGQTKVTPFMGESVLPSERTAGFFHCSVNFKTCPCLYPSLSTILDTKLIFLASSPVTCTTVTLLTSSIRRPTFSHLFGSFLSSFEKLLFQLNSQFACKCSHQCKWRKTLS